MKPIKFEAKHGDLTTYLKGDDGTLITIRHPDKNHRFGVMYYVLEVLEDFTTQRYSSYDDMLSDMFGVVKLKDYKGDEPALRDLCRTVAARHVRPMSSHTRLREHLISQSMKLEQAQAETERWKAKVNEQALEVEGLTKTLHLMHEDQLKQKLGQNALLET